MSGGPVRARALSGLDAFNCSDNHEGEMMALFIVLLILALILFGAGFAIHLLWWLLRGR